MSLRRSSRLVKDAAPTLSLGTASAWLNIMPPPPLPAAHRKREKVPKPLEEPSTPPQKRRKLSGNATPTKPPPLTPTPSAVKLISAPSVVATNVNTSSSTTLNNTLPTEHPASRPAEPHMTNAPLTTPRGSKIFGAPPVTISNENELTTENLLEKACAHLISADPRFQSIIEKHPCPVFSPQGLNEEIDPFRSLASGIMAQQVSGAAANSIKNKFISLFNSNNMFPTPSEVAAATIPHLRTAGLSERKAEYIQGLASKFADGSLTAKMLAEASDEEILETLTAIRGLGKWSVEMFMCFALKRMDILSTGDLGVQRGMAAFVGKDVAKLKAKGGGKWKYMSEKDMLDISAPYAPYRTLFMWYMWRVSDVNIDTLT